MYKKLLCILALTVFALDARIPEKKGEEEPKSVKKLKKKREMENIMSRPDDLMLLFEHERALQKSLPACDVSEVRPADE